MQALLIEPKNQQQADAIREGTKFLNNTEQLTWGLYGYAGTGKTTLAVSLIQAALASGKHVSICAPTHKALNVLDQKTGHTLHKATIQSFLGLTLVKRKGEITLEQSGISSAIHYNLVVLDEVSWIGKDLWDIVKVKFNQAQTKLITLGDKAQLFPVGEGLSPVFREVDGVTLTELVRQQEGRPLAEAVQRARKFVTQKNNNYKPYRFKLPSQVNSGGEDQVIAANETEAMKLIYKYYEDIDFRKEPDKVRILAWRNRTVDYYNALIRKRFYGPRAPKFIEGERLIARDPVFAPNGKEVLIQTSTDFVVTKPPKETNYGHYKTWELTVLPEGEKWEKVIYALHEDDEARFNNEAEKLKTEAMEKHWLWQNYYNHLETYANIRPCYALTVHNSQGSTFETVVIDGIDLARRLEIRTNPLNAKQEYNRLWYVAMSRASKRLAVIQ
jgi:hypothetical protein